MIGIYALKKGTNKRMPPAFYTKPCALCSVCSIHGTGFRKRERSALSPMPTRLFNLDANSYCLAALLIVFIPSSCNFDFDLIGSFLSTLLDLDCASLLVYGKLL